MHALCCGPRPSTATLTLKVKSRFKTRVIGSATVDITGLAPHKQVRVCYPHGILSTRCPCDSKEPLFVHSPLCCREDWCLGALSSFVALIPSFEIPKGVREYRTGSWIARE